MNTKQDQSERLLDRIKANLPEIESLYRIFIGYEEDYVYRFYHQSFKVFGAIEEIKKAKDLFEKIAPDGITLNEWYSQIADEAIGKSFDWEKTNPKWLDETRPILEAFWHSKYFLEQMLHFGTELQKSPQFLPSGWAAVLYLYNLR
ncbi:MAG: hypothetical protein H0X72_17780 [Acidobacteria bacterium]|jgi:hypothetical protein|nr:hypothetical protein [Acidobacteriota bacterium]